MKGTWCRLQAPRLRANACELWDSLTQCALRQLEPNAGTESEPLSSVGAFMRSLKFDDKRLKPGCRAVRLAASVRARREHVPTHGFPDCSWDKGG
eukprot:749343-Hanusia_phi.AAC.4